MVSTGKFLFVLANLSRYYAFFAWKSPPGNPSINAFQTFLDNFGKRSLRKVNVNMKVMLKDECAGWEEFAVLVGKFTV